MALAPLLESIVLLGGYKLLSRWSFIIFAGPRKLAPKNPDDSGRSYQNKRMGQAKLVGCGFSTTNRRSPRTKGLGQAKVEAKKNRPVCEALFTKGWARLVVIPAELLGQANFKRLIGNE
jgi:hypothetical protein